MLALYYVSDPKIPLQIIYIKDVGDNTRNPFAISSIYMEYNEDNKGYFIWIHLQAEYSGKVTSKILYI